MSLFKGERKVFNVQILPCVCSVKGASRKGRGVPTQRHSTRTGRLSSLALKVLIYILQIDSSPLLLPGLPGAVT